MRELLTTTEVAELFQVSDDTVRRWAESRMVRHVKLPSGQYRFDRKDIEPWLVFVEREES